MLALRFFGAVLFCDYEFNVCILDFLMEPFCSCFSVEFMFFLVDHCDKFFFGLLNFLESLISGVQIQLMNLLIFQGYFDLINNITKLIHADNRVVDFSLM